MNRTIFNTLVISLAILLPGFVHAQTVGGTWTGFLQVTPQVKLKLVFHVSEPESGTATVTMDSPDQGAYGIAADVGHLSADSLSVAIPSIRMSFEGKSDGEKLTGTFSQGNLKLPLTLEKGEIKVNRPQTPVPPFPYTTEEITVVNNDAHVELSGTLTLPGTMSENVPLVVMVTGSGLQNRDEEIFGHKPFAVIADHLARNGIASFRYDDRGYGKSTGNGMVPTTADNASDAKAAIDYLRGRKMFGKIGILGHSEGGAAAFMLGAGEDAPEFIVSVAGPTVRGDSISIWQNIHSLHQAGMSGQIIDDYSAALRKVTDFRISNAGKPLPDGLLNEYCPGWGDRPVYKDLLAALKNSFSRSDPWVESFLRYSPCHDIARISVPMMMVFGEKDTQVPAELNLPNAMAFAKGAVIKVYPGLNHMMQHAVTGEIPEYARIEETISPDVLSDITAFILSATRP